MRSRTVALAFAAVTALLIGLGGLQLWLYRRMKLI